MKSPVCKRCGKCCYYRKDGLMRKCKHLVILGDKTTLCRIYKQRLGKEIDDGIVCGLREELHKDIEGCPFNSRQE